MLLNYLLFQRRKHRGQAGARRRKSERSENPQRNVGALIRLRHLDRPQHLLCFRLEQSRLCLPRPAIERHIDNFERNVPAHESKKLPLVDDRIGMRQEAPPLDDQALTHQAGRRNRRRIRLTVHHRQPGPAGPSSDARPVSSRGARPCARNELLPPGRLRPWRCNTQPRGRRRPRRARSHAFQGYGSLRILKAMEIRAVLPLCGNTMCGT